MNYASELEKVSGDKEKLGDFFSDVSRLLLRDAPFCEPSLKGDYLNFDTWDEVETFCRTIPKKQDARDLLQRADESYEASYKEKEEAGSTGEAMGVALKLLAARNSPWGRHDKFWDISKEVLELAKSSGNALCVSQVLVEQSRFMTEHHFTLDAKYAREQGLKLIREAQSESKKAGSDEILIDALIEELRLISPARLEGEFADLERTRGVCASLSAMFRQKGDWKSLVNILNRECAEVLQYKRPELIVQPLREVLSVVKSHFPEEFDRIRKGVKDTFQAHGLTAALAELEKEDRS